jgi:hypothetical protein
MALLFANNNSLSEITTLPSSISGGGMTLISEQTASGSATIDFTSGIDSIYDKYVFKFINCHPANDDVTFQFQTDTGTNTNYNQTVTSTYFNASHYESGSATNLGYEASKDQAQGSSFITLAQNIGNDNDQHMSGELTIYSPSSDIFVKHFTSRVVEHHRIDLMIDCFIAGYFNTQTPLTRFQFKMSSGTFDGVIKLYGVS